MGFVCSNILDSCVIGISEKGYLKLKYKIGSGTDKINNVCRRAFMRAYIIEESYLQTLCSHIKHNRFSQTATLSDQTSAVVCCSAAIASKTQQLQQFSEHFKITLSQEQLAAVMMSNKPQYYFVYAWMKRFFDLIGDQEPNCNEIHIEPITINEIYQEYQLDNLDNRSPYKLATKNVMQRVWLSCFT